MCFKISESKLLATLKTVKDIGRQFQLALKRLLDIVLCIIVLVLGFPFFVLIAFLVKFSSPGPIFFMQQRVGRGGKIFVMIKFRTMVADHQLSVPHVWNLTEEARITSVGRFLRDFGLDELPQVFNILKGDMSIVGPRPPLPMQVDDYTERQALAFNMRPGVLSWAAVNGRRSISMEQRRDLHAWYVQNWSLWLDLKILFRSFLVVLKRENAGERLETIITKN